MGLDSIYRKEYTSKICRHCGEWFTPRDPREQYCSDECRKAMDRIRHKQFEEDKKQQRRIANDKKIRSASAKKKKIPMKTVLKYMLKHDCQYVTAVKALDKTY